MEPIETYVTLYPIVAFVFIVANGTFVTHMSVVKLHDLVVGAGDTKIGGAGDRVSIFRVDQNKLASYLSPNKDQILSADHDKYIQGHFQASKHGVCTAFKSSLSVPADIVSARNVFKGVQNSIPA